MEWFHLYTMSRTGKTIKMGSSLVVDCGGSGTRPGRRQGEEGSKWPPGGMTLLSGVMKGRKWWWLHSFVNRLKPTELHTSNNFTIGDTNLKKNGYMHMYNWFICYTPETNTTFWINYAPSFISYPKAIVPRGGVVTGQDVCYLCVVTSKQLFSKTHWELLLV